MGWLGSFGVRVLLLVLAVSGVKCEYSPTWSSLDSRPLPSWYDQAKLGVMVHWGVFSVPSFGGPAGQLAAEWFWYRLKNGTATQRHEYQAFQNRTYGENWAYADYARSFGAELFDPSALADLVAASGARYFVLTSKHHDGFCLWPASTKFSWNSVAVGPKRDLVGQVAQAMRARAPGVRFGLYHSLYEWFNPLWEADFNGGLRTDRFVEEVTMPELYELVKEYEPDIIWSDGEWDAPASYWKSTEFLAWLYNESPVRQSVVVNDRWGNATRCKHGGFYTCADRYNPGKLVHHKWENVLSMDAKSWGWSRTSPLSNYLSLEAIVEELVSTVAFGGNLLLNVAPHADGTIAPIFQERLRGLGEFMEINGGAVYETQPWKVAQNQSDVSAWFTTREHLLFVHVVGWPGRHLALEAPVPSSSTKVELIGGGELVWAGEAGQSGLNVTMPVLGELHVGVRVQPAWVLQVSGLGNV